MIVASPFTYAVNPGDEEEEKSDAVLSPRGGGGGKKASSGGGGIKEAVEKEDSFPQLTAQRYLSKHLKRGESPGGVVAPMLYLTELMGMRQTVVFERNNDLHHTACLARTQVMERALATMLTGKLTVASIKGDLYKTLVDVARVRPGLVQRSFADLLPTTFEGGNAAFLPGLNNLYASYCVFGTVDQIRAFQTHMNGHLAVARFYLPRVHTL